MNDNRQLEQRLELMGYAKGAYTLTRPSSLRKIIAARMTESAGTVPHFPLEMEVIVDELLARRGEHNKLHEKISVNDLIVKAAALSLKRVPETNVSYFPEGIVSHKDVNVAVAVAIDDGLMTPVVKQADLKSAARIAGELRDLAARAQTRRLKPDEYAGGTFTVSNLGMYGISRFGSIINEPQAAILSVGAVQERLFKQDEVIVSRNFLPVTLTCDHRVIDGAIGARWLQVFRGLIQAPGPLFD